MSTSAGKAAGTLRVALTGFGGLEDPGPGASVAHALREGWSGDLEICAWSYGSPANGAWLPGVVERLQVLPALEAGEQRLFEAIVEAHDRARIAALIPGEADV